jgi:hypothetical protein
MSVALRTALLQALMLPTDDPEPDAQTYERATQDPMPAAKQAVAEAWEATCGPFNKEKVAQHFSNWSQGQLLQNADASRLRLYAEHLLTLPVAAAND